uniref:Uncharacterized protein n=1 Tax=Rhizophora mucronata TaxID=61149 RepID=A0A2P2JM67_RHIMU
MQMALTSCKIDVCLFCLSLNLFNNLWWCEEKSLFSWLFSCFYPFCIFDLQKEFAEQGQWLMNCTFPMHQRNTFNSKLSKGFFFGSSWTEHGIFNPAHAK